MPAVFWGSQMPEVAPGLSVDVVNRAVALLNDGELVGLPTETVYGLAADADNPVAVEKIFAAKGRPADHPLIIHLGADELLPRYARNIPDEAWVLAEAFWPGPLTLILSKAPGVADVVTGGQDTVGVRVPGHPVALSLLRAFAQSRPDRGGGLAAPSANRFGRISPTAARDVAEELADAVSLILDGGDCSVGIESTIVDLSRGTPTILRPGAISAGQLSLVLGKPVSERNVDIDVPRVSGSLASHYAPLTPLQVVPDALVGLALQTTAHCGVIVRDCCEIEQSIKQRPEVMVLPNEAAGYAHDFYRALRDLDAVGFEKILVQALPESDEWVAVRDRLGRAAYGVITEHN